MAGGGRGGRGSMFWWTGVTSPHSGPTHPSEGSCSDLAIPLSTVVSIHHHQLARVSPLGIGGRGKWVMGEAIQRKSLLLSYHSYRCVLGSFTWSGSRIWKWPSVCWQHCGSRRAEPPFGDKKNLQLLQHSIHVWEQNFLWSMIKPCNNDGSRAVEVCATAGAAAKNQRLVSLYTGQGTLVTDQYYQRSANRNSWIRYQVPISTIRNHNQRLGDFYTDQCHQRSRIWVLFRDHKEEILNQGLDVLCTEQYYQRLAKKTQRLVSVCTPISNIGDQVLITSQGDPGINNPTMSVKLTFGSHFKRNLAQRSGYTRKGIIKLQWISLKYSWVVRYMSKKNDADIRNVFPNVHLRYSCTTNQKAFPENWKASSEEHWVRTHIRFRNTVQLRLQIFQSFVCNGEAAQQQKWFPQKRAIFSDTYCMTAMLSTILILWLS